MRKFGLIGYPLSHSFSQKYFTEKFKNEEITDVSYQNFSIPQMDEVSTIISSERELRGLNVTIPYKQQIIPFLDFKNDVVEQTGACNCIKIIDKKLHGYNTDVIGFEISLKEKLQSNHTHALVLGTGGAAKAVEYVLRKLEINYLLVSRNPANENVIAYKDLTIDIIQSNQLIVNTSPVGMFPDVDAYPEIPYEYLTASHYLYDLVYNPEKTVFLQKGQARGAAIKNGREMLVLQAEESWRIWNEGD